MAEQRFTKDNYITEVPVNGFEYQEGGSGVRLTFEQLAKQLRKQGAMRDSEVISQVNVEDDGIVLYMGVR